MIEPAICKEYLPYSIGGRGGWGVKRRGLGPCGAKFLGEGRVAICNGHLPYTWGGWGV